MDYGPAIAYKITSDRGSSSLPAPHSTQGLATHDNEQVLIRRRYNAITYLSESVRHVSSFSSAEMAG